jgi:hypothetical protein
MGGILSKIMVHGLEALMQNAYFVKKLALMVAWVSLLLPT